jgi:hypothetical protein
MNLKPIILQLITEQEKHINEIKARDRYFETYLSSPQYNYEFKTVGLKVARQCGKSTTIEDMYRPGDLIIVPRYRMIDCYPRDMNVVSSSSFQEHRGRAEQHYGYVFLDESEHILKSEMEMIYRCTRANWYVSLST